MVVGIPRRQRRRRAADGRYDVDVRAASVGAAGVERAGKCETRTVGRPRQPVTGLGDGRVAAVVVADARELARGDLIGPSPSRVRLEPEPPSDPSRYASTMNVYTLSLAMTVAGNVGYHLLNKIVAPAAHPFASLVATYTVGLVIALAVLAFDAPRG